MTRDQKAEALLSIRNLSVRFPENGSAGRLALDDVSLDFLPGDFTVLIGGNGSGKSTLLNAITGHLDAELTGDVDWKGRSLNNLRPHARAREIALVTQDPLRGSCAHLTVREHCDLSAAMSGRKRVGWDRLEHELKNLGADIEGSQQMRTLSGGQRQLVTVLLTVLSEPTLLLLDEPASALDARFGKLIREVILQFASGAECCTIMVSHDLSDALRSDVRLIVLGPTGRIRIDVRDPISRGIQGKDLLGWMTFAAGIGAENPSN